MIKQKIAERRQWVRAKRVLSIQYRLLKSKFKNTDKEWHLAMTEDMSIGGLAFLTDSPYHVGDTLEIKVVMSGVLDIFIGTAQIVAIQSNKNSAYHIFGIKYLKASTKKKAGKPRTRVRRAASRI